MPWVNITTRRELSKKKQQMIVRVISAALKDEIDKNPEGVFVSISRADSFYWGGVKRKDAAILDIRWIGTFSTDQKQNIARKLVNQISPEVKWEPSRVRVIFTSKAKDDWCRLPS